MKEECVKVTTLSINITKRKENVEIGETGVLLRCRLRVTSHDLKIAALYKTVYGFEMITNRILFVLTILLLFHLFKNDGVTSLYTPYNLTFNSNGFEWQGEGPIINIPERERITFLFTVSSTDPMPEIKYGIRIVSIHDNKLLQRPIYIHADDNPEKGSFNLTNAGEFGIVVRVLVKFPNRFTNETVWSVQDTGIVYTGRV